MLRFRILDTRGSQSSKLFANYAFRAAEIVSGDNIGLQTSAELQIACPKRHVGSILHASDVLEMHVDSRFVSHKRRSCRERRSYISGEAVARRRRLQLLLTNKLATLGLPSIPLRIMNSTAAIAINAANDE